MDQYAEYIVKCKKTTKDYLISAGLVLVAAIITLLLLPFVLGTIYSSIVLLVIAGAWVGAYFLMSSRNIEFEYIVTNGDLDVDTIIARRKRKQVVSVRARALELVAHKDDMRFAKDFQNTNIVKTIDASSKSGGEKTYIALFVKDNVRTKLIFEPTEKMLDLFATYNPKQVYKKCK